MTDQPETFLEWAARIGHWEVLKHYGSYLQYLKNVAHEATNQKESKQ